MLVSLEQLEGQHSARRGTKLVYIIYIIMIHYILYAAASIDVNDISLYILYAYASAEDRKHATLCEYNVKLYSVIF